MSDPMSLCKCEHSYGPVNFRRGISAEIFTGHLATMGENGNILSPGVHMDTISSQGGMRSERQKDLCTFWIFYNKHMSFVKQKVVLKWSNSELCLR